MSKETNTTEVVEATATTVSAAPSWEDAIRAKALAQQQQRAELASGPKFISFSGGALQVDKVAIPGNRLDVIILTFAAENTWYKGKYNPEVVQTPECYAVYTSAESMLPSEQAANKQATSCKDCAKFKWGSDPLGGKGKACKERYRIAIIPAPESGVVDEAAILGAELRFATLPVTSVKNFDNFASKAQMLFNRPVFGVVAALSVVPDAKTQFTVNIDPIESVPGEQMLAVLKRIDEAEKEILYELSIDEETEAVPEKPLK